MKLTLLLMIISSGAMGDGFYGDLGIGYNYGDLTYGKYSDSWGKNGIVIIDLGYKKGNHIFSLIHESDPHKNDKGMSLFNHRYRFFGD